MRQGSKTEKARPHNTTHLSARQTKTTSPAVLITSFSNPSMAHQATHLSQDDHSSATPWTTSDKRSH